MHLEDDGGIAKTHILLWQVATKVLVDPHPHPFGPGYDAVSAWKAVDQMDVIRQEVEESQVVFHHHDCLIFSQALQYPGGVDALVDIQVGADLIEKIEIRVSCCCRCNGHPLQLAAAQAGDVPVHEL